MRWHRSAGVAPCQRTAPHIWRMSSLHLDIAEPGQPELHEVADRVFAYIQPDGSKWNGFYNSELPQDEGAR